MAIPPARKYYYTLVLQIQAEKEKWESQYIRVYSKSQLKKLRQQGIDTSNLTTETEDAGKENINKKVDVRVEEEEEEDVRESFQDMVGGGGIFNVRVKGKEHTSGETTKAKLGKHQKGKQRKKTTAKNRAQRLKSHGFSFVPVNVDAALEGEQDDYAFQKAETLAERKQRIKQLKTCKRQIRKRKDAERNQAIMTKKSSNATKRAAKERAKAEKKEKAAAKAKQRAEKQLARERAALEAELLEETLACMGPTS